MTANLGVLIVMVVIKFIIMVMVRNDGCGWIHLKVPAQLHMTSHLVVISVSVTIPSPFLSKVFMKKLELKGGFSGENLILFYSEGWH